MTVGLSDEQKRWSQEIALLKAREVLVPGDTVISAAMIVYAGPFTTTFRNRLQQEWKDVVLSTDLQLSSDACLKQTLGIPVTI